MCFGVFISGGCGGDGRGNYSNASSLTVSPSILNLNVGENGIITAVNFFGEVEYAPQSIGRIRVEKIDNNTARILAIGEGETSILVTDSSETTVPVSVVVTYPTISVYSGFLSDLDFSERTAFVNENPFEVIVRVMVNPSSPIRSVVLHEVDINGNSIRVIRDLRDGGDIHDGDELAQDSVFSGRINVMPTPRPAGKYFFRVFLNNDFTKGSSLVHFYVVNNISMQEFVNASMEIQSTLESIISDFNGKTLTRPQFQQYKAHILAALKERPSVKNVMLIDNGSNIVVEFESGVVIFIVPSSGLEPGLEPSIEQDRSSGVIQQKNPQAHSLNLQGLNIRQATPNTTNINIRALAEQRVTAIGSLTTRGISPYYDIFATWWGYDSMDQPNSYWQLERSTTPTFNVTPAIEEPTISGFKNLSQYGVVVISSHGIIVNEVPVISTRKWHTSSMWYFRDVASGRLINIWGSSIAVTPAFITHHGGRGALDGIVSLAICTAPSCQDRNEKKIR